MQPNEHKEIRWRSTRSPQLHLPSPYAGRRSRSTRVGVCHHAKIDTCSASAMNDSRQLGSAVPELRSTWRTRSSCPPAGSCWPTTMTFRTATDALDRGAYRRLLQAAAQA
jgi:hypothetical protein